MIMQAMKIAGGRVVRQIVVFGALFSAIIAIVNWGPIIETNWFPVSKDFAIEYKVASPDSNLLDNSDEIEFQLRYHKVRRCEYIGWSWYVGDPVGEFARIDVRSKASDAGSNVTRPTGWQLSEPYIMAVPKSQQSKPVFGVIRYRCLLPWISEAIIGPFPSFYVEKHVDRLAPLYRPFVTARFAIGR